MDNVKNSTEFTEFDTVTKRKQPYVYFVEYDVKFVAVIIINM